MSEPRRWLDDASDVSPDELSALEAALGAPEPAELALAEQAKHTVWNALVAKLPAAAGAAAGTASIAAGKATLVATLAKPLAIGLALGAGTAGGIAVTQRATAPAAPSVQVPSARARAQAPGVSKPRPPTRSFEPAPATTDAPESAAAKEAGVAPRAPDPASFPNPPPLGATKLPMPGEIPSVASFPADASDVSAGDRAEIDRMGTARALLRTGQPRAALGALDAIAKDFPNGTLAQEREALAIEALGALGQRDAARARATRFLQRYPASPHAAMVKSALE